MSDTITSATREQAARSGGTSGNAIYALVECALAKRDIRGITAIDLGCGRSALQSVISKRFDRYLGVDAVRYLEFPAGAEFIEADLNSINLPIPSQSADAAFAVEIIEHLENPRAFFREMVRVVKPGGWIVVTTPNQLSLLSLGTLFLKNRFSAFQDVHYPAHITALLESDLERIAFELKLNDVAIEYSCQGRIVLTGANYPRFFRASFHALVPTMFS